MAQVCDMMIGSAARGGLETSSVYHQLFRALQDTMRTRFANPYAYGFAGARVFRLGTRMGYYRETQRYRPGYVTPPKAMGWSAAMWRTQEVDWDIARIDRIWTRFRNKLERPTLYRTGPYLAWRYRDHPIHRYRLWVLSHLARDRGWFVTRAMPDGEICIVDALIPESADPSPLAATLAIALAKASAQVAPIYAWFLPSCDTQEDEPGIGGEFRVNPWHTQDPNPRFQPGDTDVY